MSKNFWQVKKGASFSPGLTADPSNPTAGDLYFNSSLNAFRQYDGSSWATLAASNAFVPYPSNVQRFVSGSGTYGLSYWFVVFSANATAGATYTNNAHTFTVVNTISGASKLLMTSTGAPASSGTLTKSSGTGDSTISFISFTAPLEIRISMVGGGGGGGGVDSGIGAAGTSSTFGSGPLLIAPGGSGGSQVTGAPSAPGGIAPTINSPAITIISAEGGDSGGGGPDNGAVTFTSMSSGGSSALGGAGGALYGFGSDGKANTGGGGSGEGSNNTSATPGIGGGAGAYIEALIQNPSSTYSFTVGDGGIGGIGSYGHGGNGGSGVIVIEEHFQ